MFVRHRVAAQQPHEEEEQKTLPQVLRDRQTLALSNSSIQGSSKAVLHNSLVCGGEQQSRYREPGINGQCDPPNRVCN
jgi:hypothetical protein